MKIMVFCFFVFLCVFPQRVSFTEHVSPSSSLEVSKLQIFMSKQLCLSRGVAVTVLQFICWLADISPENKDLRHELDPAKNEVHLKF